MRCAGSFFYFQVITGHFREYSSNGDSHRYNDEEGITQGGARDGNIKGFSKI